ncbi:Gfo/Idh/MocA family oxidoreductase [uncultured Victivallis sp.]|uniref:Gfo/Idh/MocA family protein n=1 Tax=uncultured Victivallis sp. TaxID=354118 RepID=UPI0025E965BC|nr:Gfo/Idh/MocA family oxidoreductase [uncultured Victivallis sp.]
MKTVKIGIIGTGGRGGHACNAHRPEEGWEVVMGADISPVARREFTEKFPDATAVEDYRELLANPELKVVFIMAPDFLHEEMAVAALEAGKAVYLEKPMAISIEGCDRILETAMRTGSKLFVGHNMRYFPSILKMKEVIDSGLIGEVQAGWCRHFINYGGDAYFRDWHSEQKNTCGLLLQKGAHDIDVMHWLMGSHTKRVVGMGMLSVYDRCARRSPDEPGCAKWSDEHYPPLEQTGFSPVIDVEDHNMILMQLENGTQAVYMQCHYTPDAERNYTFIGTKGRVENIGDSGDCRIHVWTRRGPRETPDIIYHLKPGSGTHGGSDPMIISNFLAFVRDGVPTNATPLAARDAVAAGVLGHKSMRNGNMPQEVPPLPPEIVRYFENGQKR